MKILFKDKKDLSNKLIKSMPEHFYIGGRETMTPEMLSCDVISVKNSKVDNRLIKQMPNLKWVMNRDRCPDNINIKHCKENNIGVINIISSQNKIANWVEKTIKKEYYLPYYTVFTESDLSKCLKSKFEHVQTLNLKSSKRKIYEYLRNTNTLIISLPLMNSTKNMFNYELLNILPIDSTIINLSDGKIINNKDLLKVINEKRVTHVTSDNIEFNYREELLDTKKVIYTKGKAWKCNHNVKDYIKLVKKHVNSLKNEKPINVILERTNMEIDVFWD